MKPGFFPGVLLGLAFALAGLGYWAGFTQGQAIKPDYDVRVLNQAMFLYLNNKSGTLYICQVNGECKKAGTTK